jgi:hypothetical protein
MGPHSDYLNNPEIFKDLVEQTILDIDSARIGARKITKQLFKR